MRLTGYKKRIFIFNVSMKDSKWFTKSLLNDLALKSWGKTLLKLVRFFVVLDDKGV